MIPSKTILTFTIAAIVAIFAACGNGPADPPIAPKADYSDPKIAAYLKYIDVECRAIGDQHECHARALAYARHAR